MVYHTTWLLIEGPLVDSAVRSTRTMVGITYNSTTCAPQGIFSCLGSRRVKKLKLRQDRSSACSRFAFLIHPIPYLPFICVAFPSTNGEATAITTTVHNQI